MVGSDRVKRKYTQMNDGSIRTETYHVKRPKMSSEYQYRMGAVDGHNYRRQSGKGTSSLEKICITRNTKDRVFINIVSWILINLYLIKKFFIWGGEAKKNPVEFQEDIAMALIYNQFLSEAQRSSELSNESDDEPQNDPNDCRKHPQYKKNKCKFCYRAKTVFYCAKCSNPQRPKLRKEKGPKGGTKYTQSGYMHFCRYSGCFDKHQCGQISARRTKAQMQAASFRI